MFFGVSERARGGPWRGPHAHLLFPRPRILPFQNNNRCAGRWQVTSSIIGATTMEQLKENIDAFDVVLTDECLKDVEKVHQRYRDPTTRPIELTLILLILSSKCKKRKGRERGKREEVEVARKRRENARLDCLLIFISPFFPFLVFKGRERAAHLFLSPASSTTRSNFCFLSRARREKERVLRDRERSAEKKKTSPFFLARQRHKLPCCSPSSQKRGPSRDPVTPPR